MPGNLIRPIVTTALLAMAAPAFAQPQAASAALAVNTSGIDLSTPEGRKALDRRVDNAINRVCGSIVLGTREEADAVAACRLETRAEVQPQVDAMLVRASVKVPGN